MAERIFATLLDKMIKYDYDTIGSLQDMIRILDHLCDEDKVKHGMIIHSIKNTIKGYGTQNYQLLTNKQSKNLIHVLEQFEFSDKTVKSAKTEIDNFNNQHDEKFYPSYKSVTQQKVEQNIIKIDPDDTIYAVILNLLTQLSYDTLSSQINNIVLEYVDIVKDLYDPKYSAVVNEIEAMLKKNGWTESGFYSEPNKIKIMDELQPIVNKYLF